MNYIVLIFLDLGSKLILLINNNCQLMVLDFVTAEGR